MMSSLSILLVVCVAVLLALIQYVDACTTYVIGKKATADGSVMCSHTNDGSGTTDPRFVRIPARDFAAGSMRPIWASPESYPRYVGTERQAPEYYSENCLAGKGLCDDFEPIGYIPQVEHTYAYYETTYGILNENQVGIGESTCSGVFVGKAVNAGGSALLSVDQLSQIAMERATTAREAITIMGNLAEKYGFYGESTSFEGGSESLMVRLDYSSRRCALHFALDGSGCLYRLLIQMRAGCSTF
jgi:dipeptidase